MHSGMRRMPAERARHAKRLGHVQAAGSGPAAKVLAGNSSNGATATTQAQADTTSAAAATSQSAPPTTATKQSSSSSLPPSSTPPLSSAPSSAASQSSVSSATHSTDSLVPVTTPSSSFVVQSITLIHTSDTPSSTSTPQSVAAVTSHGLSGGAIAGIIAGAVVVGVALIVFFVRKTVLRRRETKIISWNGTPGLGANFLDEPKVVSDDADVPLRTAPLSPFDTHGKSMYSTPVPSIAPVQLPTMPAYSIPMPPSATYNNPAYPTQPAPLTYGPGNTAAFGMARGAAGTGSSSPLPVAGAQRAPMEAIVKCTFVPTLPDELSITTGERIFVVEQYDDGWDLCMNRRGDRGMVPRECLELAPSDQPDIGWKNPKRLSSLNLDGRRY